MRYGMIAIPARMASTRLPNKLLLNETGKPLLAHVIERAQAAVAASAGLLRSVVVACDEPQLAQVARDCGVVAVMTSPDHRCGTTRIAEAAARLPLQTVGDFVVNVQGDEPELAPSAVVRVARELLQSIPRPTVNLGSAEAGPPMATLAIPGDEAIKNNPNAVKVVFDDNGRALYFSRAPIPYDRGPKPDDVPPCYHHLGIYAYEVGFLQRYAQMPPALLEERESLEQLRVLQAGYPIQVAVIPPHWAGKGIDTPEDYAAFVQRRAA